MKITVIDISMREKKKIGGSYELYLNIYWPRQRFILKIVKNLEVHNRSRQIIPKRSAYFRLMLPQTNESLHIAVVFPIDKKWHLCQKRQHSLIWELQCPIFCKIWFQYSISAWCSYQIRQRRCIHLPYKAWWSISHGEADIYKFVKSISVFK